MNPYGGLSLRGGTAAPCWKLETTTTTTATTRYYYNTSSSHVRCFGPATAVAWHLC